MNAVFFAGSTPTYSGTLKDENNTAIPNNALVSLTLSLYYKATTGAITIVNSRNDQDVLGGAKTGQNNVAVSAGGVVTWSLQQADTTIVSAVPSDAEQWNYTARLVAVYNSTRRLVTEFAIPLKRLQSLS